MENKTITIGRDKSCDVVIPDIKANEKISGRHATIKCVKNGNGSTNDFILEDHSTNGTYVNSKLILNGTYYIQKGDVITLGKNYILDWAIILPFFEGKPIDIKPQVGRITKSKATSNQNSPREYTSADPVYPDSIPNVEETPDNTGFIFTGKHWLITLGAFILGLLFGIILG